ncbi:MAG: NADP oxidoreductase [Actinobacteria bacterium]|nr:NADP oxidoreductase [Actinomycetota bacterium]
MRIGILGTGTVARTLGDALGGAGHDVVLGSRTAGEDKITFAEAVAHGELLVNATAGAGSVDAIGASARADREGKVLLDVSNPLDFPSGELRLTVSNDDSLGEVIQRAFPELRVVKSLNTVTASVMVDPGSVPGDHVLFLAGADPTAKAVVRDLLGELGWRDVQLIDLGGIAGARGMEMYLPLWLTLMQTLGTPVFNVTVERGRTPEAGQ